VSAGPVIATAWIKPDYQASLDRAGASIRELTPADPLPDALDGCDGLLLTGGVDVDPAAYGERPHPTVEIDPVRDAYELALARLALERDLPVLAICRGVQVLNVAAGGTLVQDIPSALEEPLQHTVTEPRHAIAHDVRVAAGTLLADLLDGKSSVPVNSRHHQAIKRAAAGFVVSATAPDGIVEAIEKPAASFCLGVQWHPENFWRTGEFRGLFEGFVSAAARLRSRKGGDRLDVRRVGE
jgi:putative glutamine amidotransferase